PRQFPRSSQSPHGPILPGRPAHPTPTRPPPGSVRARPLARAREPPEVTAHRNCASRHVRQPELHVAADVPAPDRCRNCTFGPANVAGTGRIGPVVRGAAGAAGTETTAATVARDGLVFDVTTAGPPDGEPVVLLHGFPQSARCWEAVTPALTAAGLRTFAPDQRGYSPGARPTGRAAYRMTELVADAAVVV